MTSENEEKNKNPYKPTLAEIYYWKAYADPHTKPNRADISRKAIKMMRDDGVSEKDIPEEESVRKMTYQWENKEGYRDWVKQVWASSMEDMKPWLDKVGLRRGVRDFRYWEAMQMKYANYKRKSDITTDDKPINNTDQIANLLLNTLKDGGGKEGSKDTEKGGDGEVKSNEGEVSSNPSI